MRYHWRISKFDPLSVTSSKEEDDWTSISDVGKSFVGVPLTRAEYERVEETYLSSARSFMRDSGVNELSVSDKQLSSIASPRADAVTEGSVLDAEAALEVVRLELREELACRLDGDGFHLAIGFDYYMFVGSDFPCRNAVEWTTSSGLFVEPNIISPYLSG